MCGIVAFLDLARAMAPSRYDVIAGVMADRLAHRGPDGCGVWTDPRAGIALGFRRLAVLDLSPAGSQPMHSADGRLVMVFNGEIYNHRALRRALEAEGAGPWRGHSDSEVLLAAIAQWGFVPTLERVNGMFAIAVWDAGTRRLALARDRFGEKPLYYGWIGGTFLAASELKALHPHPAWTGAIDDASLELFLAYGYIPAPWTAFSGMRKLPPGCMIEIAPDGSGAPRPYWSATACAAEAAASPFAHGAGEAAEALQALVDDAVAMRMEADVKLGAFLSGGIDSATVVAAMQRAGHGRVESFTIGFPDARHDELQAAEAVAHHLGTEHTTLRASDAECREVLPHLAAVYDEPFADPSQVPTLVLCRLTRAHVTVSLSGDGGDEFFGGYDRYRTAARAWRRIERWPRAVRHGARATVGLLAGRELRPLRRLRRLAGRIGHDFPDSLYRDYVSRWHAGDRLVRGQERHETLLDAPLEAGPPSLEQRFMLRDAMTYLPDDLMVKIDRASMAFGLEVRAPLLDHRIAAFAWSLPPDFADGKRLLREMLYRRVPRALVDRPKHGFEPPIARWLKEGLREWADALLEPARLERHGIRECRARRRALERPSQRAAQLGLCALAGADARSVARTSSRCGAGRAAGTAPRQLALEALKARHRRRQRIVHGDPLPRRFAETFALHRPARDERQHRRRQGSGIAGRHHDTGIGDDRGDIADIARDARDATGHRLADDIGEPLAARGQHHHVERRQNGLDGIALAERVQPPAEAGRRHQRLGSGADQDKGRIGARFGDEDGGFQEGVVVLHRVDPRHHADEDLRGSDAEVLPRRRAARSIGTEEIGVEAVRHDLPAPRMIAERSVIAPPGLAVGEDCRGIARRPRQRAAHQPHLARIVLQRHMRAAQVPDDRNAGQERSRQRHQVGMIEPALQQSRLLGADQPPQSQERRERYRGTPHAELAPHAETMHRNSGRHERRRATAAVDERDHHRREPAAVHVGQQAHQHRLGAAAVEGGDEMQDLERRHGGRDPSQRRRRRSNHGADGRLCEAIVSEPRRG